MTDISSSRSIAQLYEADLTWVDGRFQRDVRVAVDTAGRIEAVGALDGNVTQQLKGKALLPGFVNAHSHAFQRGLRGHGETFVEGAGSFWTWRKAMYELVGRMDETMMYELSRQAFEEMLAAGITTVGEFHYLHHDASEAGFAFDDVVLRAAADAGIRIVLLNAYYATGGIGEPLQGGQLRFGSRSVSEYLDQLDALAARMTSQTQSLGMVAHSIRAVPIENVMILQQESDKRGMVLHMHVEEQQEEINACVDHYHHPPMALLNEHVAVSSRFTAVHCTHSAAADLDLYLEAGGNVCICPLTEANLGDGLANIPRMLHHNGCVCLGTDSNARISMLEEMRWLEYGQRLQLQQRGVCVDDAGQVAPRLLEMATLNGARALGVRAGAIRKGAWADFVTIDLDNAALRGSPDESLLAALVFGSGNDAIAGVCVGGRWFDF